MPFCTSCGTELQPDAAFCSTCGISVNKTSATANSSATQYTTTPAKPIEPPFKFHLGGFFGGLLVIIGFFAPWVSLKNFGIDIDGPNGLWICINSIKSIFSEEKGKLFFIILVICFAVIVFTALGCFLYGFIKDSLSDTDFSDAKNAGFIALVVMGILIAIVVSKFGDEFGITITWNEDNVDVIMDALGRGFWLTFFGTIVLGLSSPRKKV